MNINKIILCLSACFFLVSCERAPQKRTYEEIVLKKPSLPGNMMPDDPHRLLRNDPAFKAMFEKNAPDMGGMPSSAANDITWTAPAGWETKPGAGFRLVSFASTDPANVIDVSIVKLEGPAGGVKANIIRWMGQINVPAPADSAFDGFLAKQKKIKTAEGVPAIMIDFGELQSDRSSDAPSMIAAIIEQPDFKLFIKMTGTKSALKHHLSAFLSLCNSIKIPQ